MVSADSAVCSRRSTWPASDQPGRLQINAPLSRWSQMDSSDSASGCDEQRNNVVRMYRSGDMTSMATQFKLWLYHNSV
jgi:hypothetical protein